MYAVGTLYGRCVHAINRKFDNIMGISRRNHSALTVVSNAVQTLSHRRLVCQGLYVSPVFEKRMYLHVSILCKSRTSRVGCVVWRKMFSRHIKCRLAFCCTVLGNIFAQNAYIILYFNCESAVLYVFKSLQETCTTLKDQQMLYKDNQRGIMQQR